MVNSCWAPGCQTGYRRTRSEWTGIRHLFKVPGDADRRAQWNRKIPRDGILKSSDHICDLHFEKQYLLKTYDVVVKGETVQIPRGKWTLTDDAVPTIFPNVPSYLSQKLPKRRRALNRVSSEQESYAVGVDDKPEYNKATPEQAEHSRQAACLNNVAAEELSKVEKSKKQGSCVKCKTVLARIYHQNRMLRFKNGEISQLKKQVKELRKENLKLKSKCIAVDQMSPKLKRMMLQAVQNVDAKGSTGNRYSREWIVDCLLIKCKSPATYKMLRQQEYLPLPCITTLNNHIRNLRPDFGFDRNLCSGLQTKLKDMSVAERRGILMFDEIQISKHLDFRRDLHKTVGFVDFGGLEKEEGCQSKEGDHALVFLFRPHLGGWMQTIGSFCSAGTTVSTVLAQLVLQAIVLLENCGAKVDGLVCDGASANRKALKMMGWCGRMGSVVNKMINPCDNTRDIYFFSDFPHILKTVRNNLLSNKMFVTRDGMVKMDHYRALLDSDLSLNNCLRAVPKLSLKHIQPNNFQKMSVSLAAQLFSKTVACGFELYRNHASDLHDIDATIKFTEKMNHIIDLMNGRRPVDGIRLGGRHDKLKELKDSIQWLDDWENHIKELPRSQQKLFLSSQTSEGLRLSLQSCHDLSSLLLKDGFSYVLTGRFNQDPLEMFFGIIRQSCGGDDHPSANQFLFVYRLLSVSSLIRPPKTASVKTESAALLVRIQSIQESKPQSMFDRLENKLKTLLHGDDMTWDDEETDQLLLDCCSSDGIGECDTVDECLQWTCSNDNSDNRDINSGDPLMMTCTSENTNQNPQHCVLYYLGGYVAYKMKKFTKCDMCMNSLSGTYDPEKTEARLIMLKSHGGLQIPSNSLYSLVEWLETLMKNFLSKPTPYTYQEIINDVLENNELSNFAIGCDAHKTGLTARCINFYVATRLHFSNREINKKRTSRSDKMAHSKLSKLT